MELDDRKVKILEAIIRNYLETGEPVGSRTISKFTDLNLSSATIRNEMADLGGAWIHHSAAHLRRKNSFRCRLQIICGQNDGRQEAGT